MFKVKTLLICMAVLLLWSMPLSANNHEIDLTWSLPSHTVANEDCTQQGVPVVKPIAVTIQMVPYQTGQTPDWSTAQVIEAGADIEAFTITGLPAETGYLIRIGSHYMDEPVFCWTNPIIVTTPADPPPQGCTNLQSPNVR